MSSSSSPTLVLELRQRWRRVLPAALLLLAALSLPWLISATSLGMLVLAILLVSAIAVAAIWQSGIGRPAAQLATIVWGQDQLWHLQFQTGEPVTATLSGRSWLSPWLMCLKFRAETGSRHQILVWRGELSSVVWQQWQLRLRLDARRATGSGTGRAAA